MLLQIKQWESKYICDFDCVRNGDITEEKLYHKILAMYYEYVSTNSIEPFTIVYGKGRGFCVNANSHVGVIVYEEITLYITSMIPELTLGKILYLKAQAEEVDSDSETRRVIAQKLNDEEEIGAVDYFVVSFLNSVDSILCNGILTQLQPQETQSRTIEGQLMLKQQIQKHPAYDSYHTKRTVSSEDILINQVIKVALIKARELSKLEWILPFVNSALTSFDAVSVLDEIDVSQYPKVSEYTAIKRIDYEDALLFAKYILFGYDPTEGKGNAYFPEFMLDMNSVFEFYVTVGLCKIFKTGFSIKRCFTLGVGPVDIPIERKNIELDGYYENGEKRVVLDTKNKYRSVLDRDVADFIAGNPDIYQQYYYASRLNSNNIILVYPSSRKRTEPIGKYQLNFPGNKNVTLYTWALHITGTPRQNKNALISLAQFIESL